MKRKCSFKKRAAVGQVLKYLFVYRFAKFQELIAVQTGVSARQQMLMFKYEEFKPDPMAPASSYPNTSVRM